MEILSPFLTDFFTPFSVSIFWLSIWIMPVVFGSTQTSIPSFNAFSLIFCTRAWRPVRINTSWYVFLATWSSLITVPNSTSDFLPGKVIDTLPGVRLWRAGGNVSCIVSRSRNFGFIARRMKKIAAITARINTSTPITIVHTDFTFTRIVNRALCPYSSAIRRFTSWLPFFNGTIWNVLVSGLKETFAFISLSSSISQLILDVASYVVISSRGISLVFPNGFPNSDTFFTSPLFTDNGVLFMIILYGVVSFEKLSFLPLRTTFTV